ncbi:MAG: hypothetical protein JST82_12270 [Bacteroidetes bacterium]|nr:hypothetical protein [Bacteroidota bacterium]
MSNANEKVNNPEAEMQKMSEEQLAKVNGGYIICDGDTPPTPDSYPCHDSYTGKPIITPVDSRCIVTTATMRNLHDKDDDCDELQTFRKYRDTYLLHQPDGGDLISEYYNIAPAIVDSINSKPNAKEIYAEFWKNVLEPCLQMMKSGKNEEVREFYKKSIEELKSAHLS